MENKMSTISETYYNCERCGKPTPSVAVCNCTDKKYSEAELQQEIAKASSGITANQLLNHIADDVKYDRTFTYSELEEALETLRKRKEK